MKDESNAGSRSIRVLELLEVICAMDRPASAIDIEMASGLPKATVHRLCNLLLEEGYLRRDINGRGYEAGERFSKLAIQLLSNQSGRGERHAILESVTRDIGETCNIALPLSTSMQYLDRVESEWPLRIQLPTGSNVPLHCTASGKLYLSSLAKSRRQRLIEKLPLDKKSSNSITDADELLKATDQIAKTKIGTDNEEFIPGMVAVAVPVTDKKGKLLATLATHGPVVRMTFDQAMGHVPRLQRAAAELSASFE
ncbi:IclR family transcriptional regulator [Thalassospiraceae bacterium LMO-JJ14]|nr:IclR family transcriptional regulator [Thalassospiraceae bacterium LMO-JJ14]